MLLLPGLLVLGALVLPALAASDNLHAVIESTSYDRLVLGQRTLRGTWDPHFPLGTAALMSVPWRFGWDPVAFGRAVSLLAAVVASGFLFTLVRRASGGVGAAFAAAAIWLVPSFTRGAVVTGEEALCTAWMLCAAWALVRGHEARGRVDAWMALSAVAVNATVLYRLDAMTLVPLFVLLGFAAFGIKRGLVHGLFCGLSTVGHMALSARLVGDPIGFARVASMNIRRNADGFDALGPGVLPVNLAGELGGWVVLIGAMLGLVHLLRAQVAHLPGARAASRTLGVLLGGAFVIDLVLTMLGAMEARTMRYLVPLLTLCVAGIGALVGELWARDRRIGSVIGIGLAALMIGHGVPEIRRQAAQEKLPVGLVEAAEWVGANAAGRVLVGEQHPTFVVESGLPYAQLDVLPPGAPGQSGVELLRQRMHGVDWLVQVEGNPPDQQIRALGGLTLQHSTTCCASYRARR